MAEKSSVWTRTCERTTTASAETVWGILSDVRGWKKWNAGVASVSLEGPFAPGAWFEMEIPGGPVIRTQIVEVRAPSLYVDRTPLGDTLVEVRHRIESLSGGGCRIAFEARAEGPDASAFGEGASADFPQVIAALAALAEGNSH